MKKVNAANDNHPPYWSLPVLDRAREMTARLEAKRRAALKAAARRGAGIIRFQQSRAEGERPARGGSQRRSRARATRFWRLWDAMGIGSQYGLTVVSAMILILGLMEVLSWRAGDS